MSIGQNKMVLARLKRGPLTALQAFRELGCLRLAARVWDLRIKGYTIDTSIVAVGEHKRVARYELRSRRIRDEGEPS